MKSHAIQVRIQRGSLPLCDHWAYSGTGVVERRRTILPLPSGTAIQLSPRHDDPTSPSPPTKGGEGRGEEGCLTNSETPLPNPLPVRASRGDGEARWLRAAALRSSAQLCAI